MAVTPDMVADQLAKAFEASERVAAFYPTDPDETDMNGMAEASYEGWLLVVRERMEWTIARKQVRAAIRQEGKP